MVHIDVHGCERQGWLRTRSARLTAAATSMERPHLIPRSTGFMTLLQLGFRHHHCAYAHAILSTTIVEEHPYRHDTRINLYPDSKMVYFKENSPPPPARPLSTFTTA